MKYLFFDLDGTIAENDNPPSELTRRALQELRRRGHRTFLCTGRTLCDIYPAVASIGFDGVISGAGANIVINGDTLFQSLIPRPLLKETVLRMLESNISGVLEGTEQMYIVKGEVPLGWHIPMPVILRMEQLETVQKIEKMTLHIATAAQIEPLRNFLEQYYDLYPHSNGTSCELVCKGCNKGSAIHRVLSHYHAPSQNAVAFGDSLNDCAMFQSVKTSIAMGNAPPALLNIATMVTGTIQQEGVCQMLEQLGFIEKLSTD